MDRMNAISAYVATGLRKGRALMLMLALAVTAIIIGGPPAFATGPTATDYTTSFDDSLAYLNFAGNSTSFLTVLWAKIAPYMIAVIGIVVMGGIVWRLSGKAKRIAG